MIFQVVLGSEVQYLKNNGIFVLYYIFCHYLQYWLSRLKICDILLRTVRIFKERCLGKQNQACHVAFIICYFLLVWLVFVALPSSSQILISSQFILFRLPLVLRYFSHPISSLIMICLQVFSRKKISFTIIYISAPQKVLYHCLLITLAPHPPPSTPTSGAHEPEMSKEFTLEIFLDLNWFDSAFADWFRIINSSLALGRIGNILGSEDLPKGPDPYTITRVLFSSNSDCLRLTSHISDNWLLRFIFSHSKNPLLAPKRNVKEENTVNMIHPCRCTH